MSNDFYNLFKRIIRECNYTNTYKMTWAKALVEISLEEEYNKNRIKNHSKQIYKILLESNYIFWLNPRK